MRNQHDTPTELASPIQAPRGLEISASPTVNETSTEQQKNHEPQNSKKPSEEMQGESSTEPHTETNTPNLIACSGKTANLRRAAKNDPPPARDQHAHIDPEAPEQPEEPRKAPDQCIAMGQAQNGAQEAAQTAELVQASLLAGDDDLERESEPPKSKQKRQRKSAEPASEYRKVVNRTLAELGFKVGNQGRPHEAVVEAMELIAVEDLKPMLLWATEGWRSEWYRLEKIAEHATAWKAREAQRRRSERPRVEDMDLSAYDITEEDWEAQRKWFAEKKRKEAEERKNYWNTPAVSA